MSRSIPLALAVLASTCLPACPSGGGAGSFRTPGPVSCSWALVPETVPDDPCGPANEGLTDVDWDEALGERPVESGWLEGDLSQTAGGLRITMPDGSVAGVVSDTAGLFSGLSGPGRLYYSAWTGDSHGGGAVAVEAEAGRLLVGNMREIPAAVADAWGISMSFGEVCPEVAGSSCGPFGIRAVDLACGDGSMTPLAVGEILHIGEDLAFRLNASWKNHVFECQQGDDFALSYVLWSRSLHDAVPVD